MKLKVCGMKYEENIKEVAMLQPDYMGFIFWEGSKRYLDNPIPKDIPSTIKKTGVFVDATLEEIIEKVKTYTLQAVQLHGKESPELCKQLKTEQPQVEIIKVFSIGNNFSFEQLTPYETMCDFYLFDTKGKLPGGNGDTFNWAVLENYPSQKPFFLSGGIGLEQLNDIASFCKKEASKYCYAIDVNSMFEIKPGLKDVGKIKDLKSKI
ncbi:phosphoribosylanthranilate isomerase [Leptobacterium sp. I13]|uniref:phosphoribosylanthranilate isomerase n=1 Tax=Leptobacterium meishanense TaxID=3128904 RepID=UPI0030EEC37B